MKYKNIVMLIGAAAFLISFNIQASNPGVNAIDCVKASTSTFEHDNLIFENKCEYKIFVVWCGDLKPNQSQKNTSSCGDGLNNTYYTRATNLNANQGTLTTMQNNGKYQFAACKGRIGVDATAGNIKYLPSFERTNGLNGFVSFEIKGLVHQSKDQGRYNCTKADH